VIVGCASVEQTGMCCRLHTCMMEWLPRSLTVQAGMCGKIITGPAGLPTELSQESNCLNYATAGCQCTPSHLLKCDTAATTAHGFGNLRVVDRTAVRNNPCQSWSGLVLGELLLLVLAISLTHRPATWQQNTIIDKGRSLVNLTSGAGDTCIKACKC
jgi:hypothetical protein